MDPKRNEKYMSSEEINSYFSFTFWYTRVSSDIFYFLLHFLDINSWFNKGKILLAVEWKEFDEASDSPGFL